MSDLSEATKLEAMKMAVQLTTLYVKNRNEILNARDLHWLGLDDKKAGYSLPEIVDGMYRHLLSSMGK
ncbi:hypothetical protein EGJ23_04360 [Pseudomonas sp. o96-267]|uniref:hypothetical protein n=1 Tax=Pseudomonas sp. o96-267 TaxID=2479853 RepID=UPI000F7AA75A|nr:hypothetical protein [Pseudomonas sp. o96-267]RRV28619.1 hypothetical protein EGJ23_04360 [Pseudomonas sp. o96-267]